MQTTRAFAAIELGAVAVGTLAKLTKQMNSASDAVRWVAPEQLHVSLKFLGDVDNVMLPEICKVLRDCADGIEPFALELNGLGSFPKGKPPRVIWAGVADPTGLLGQLHARIDAALAQLGIAPEGRGYTPHVTLGRVRRGTDREEIERLLNATELGPAVRCEVDEFVLMASEKERNRVVYEAIDHIEL